MALSKDASRNAAAAAAYDQYSSSSAFESSAHLLHGVLHTNGFGHLLRINGLEGGSAHLTGKAVKALPYQISNAQRLFRMNVAAATELDLDSLFLKSGDAPSPSRYQSQYTAALSLAISLQSMT